MNHWLKRVFLAAAPLLLAGCLWGPGKFASDLTLRKDGSFVLDYRGEIVLQTPDNAKTGQPTWSDEFARCYEDGSVITVYDPFVAKTLADESERKPRPCTASQLAKAKSDYEKQRAEQVEQQRASDKEMAKVFGLAGLDEESGRAFATKLMKYAGWRSVTYVGNGVFDVDYHVQGTAKQDFLFPALPDNALIIPFVAIRRRADGAVIVTAPGLAGGAGALASRIPEAANPAKGGPVSRAEGRFTVHTDGEIMTNNSEDGPAADPLGRQLHWDIAPASNKVPETLIRL